MLVAAALQVAAAWYGALALALGWVWGGGGRDLVAGFGCARVDDGVGLLRWRPAFGPGFAAFFLGIFFFFLGGGNSVCVSNSPALVCGRGAVDPAGIRCEMGLIQWVVFV